MMWRERHWFRLLRDTRLHLTYDQWRHEYVDQRTTDRWVLRLQLVVVDKHRKDTV